MQDDLTFTSGQHIHLVGIGGAGLSAIARVLLERGCRVSGSDRALNAQTAALARDGAAIYAGHDAAHIRGADLLLISSAVQDNPEVEAARAAGIPVCKRRDIMAALLAGRHVIAVAGTHGKTTTTAMIVHLLRETGLDPGYIVGGVMRNTGTNAANGSGHAFVIEADEYDNMFHGLRPDTIVLTNVEWDHPDFFPDEAALVRSFSTFIGLLDATSGALIACADDPGALRLHAHAAVRSGHTYGLSAGRADHYHAGDITVTPDGSTRFTLTYQPSNPDAAPQTVGTAQMPLTGRHHVLNATAAVIAAQRAGAAFDGALAALASFQGTGRRMEQRGVVHAAGGAVIVIDDYAHHPTAIDATLRAARLRYPGHALWAVWQPHTYSRTQALWAGYATAFSAADHVLVTPVYAAREAPVAGFDAAALAAGIQHPDARPAADLADATRLLLADVRAPAIILIMSAGDAPQIGEQFLAERG